MNTNISMIANCLRLRMDGYKKAIAMVKGEIPWENCHNWPSYPCKDVNDERNVTYWEGCAKELQNTLDMLTAYCK